MTVPIDFGAARMDRVRELLTVQQVAAMIGCSSKTVYCNLARGKFLAPMRIGPRLVRWDREELEAWLRSC